MKNRINYCLFGTRRDGLSDKGVIVGYNERFMSHALSIYRLDQPVERGSVWDNSNILSEIFTLCFRDLQSIDGFIKQLMILRNQMFTEELHNEGQKQRDRDR